MTKKRKLKTKRMTFQEFRRRVLHAFAVFKHFDDWEEYCQGFDIDKECERGRESIKAAWRRDL